MSHRFRHSMVLHLRSLRKLESKPLIAWVVSPVLTRPVVPPNSALFVRSILPGQR
jgi:hypothetical protein